MSAGYAFVPFPDHVRVCVRHEAVHDKLVPGTVSGRLEITYVCEQPVHIGAGFKGLMDGKVVRRGTLVRGNPGIPGSSLKGALRARYEAITKSCIQGRPKENWKVRSRTYGLDGAPAKLTWEARSKAIFNSREDPKSQELCPACALWGCMSFRSRVAVSDFESVEARPFEVAPMPKQFSPNVHHVGPSRRPMSGGGGDREPALEVTDLYGRKFAVGPMPSSTEAPEFVQVIRRTEHVRGILRLKNVRLYELGGLLVALGGGPQKSLLKIGGGKALGFGRIRLTSIGYTLQDHLGAEITSDENGWNKAFIGSEDYFSDGTTQLVHIHQGDC